MDKNLICTNNTKDEDTFNELSVSVGLARCHGDIALNIGAYNLFKDIDKYLKET